MAQRPTRRSHADKARENNATLFHTVERCAAQGIPGALVAAVIMWGQPAAIIELSRKLIERRRSRAMTKLQKGGALSRFHGEIDPALVTWLAVTMVEWCAVQRIPPPPDLADLLKVHFEVDDFDRRATRSAAARARAIDYLARYPHALHKNVAKYAGVTEAAVSKWTREPTFHQAVARLQAARLAVGRAPSKRKPRLTRHT